MRSVSPLSNDYLYNKNIKPIPTTNINPISIPNTHLYYYQDGVLYHPNKNNKNEGIFIGYDGPTILFNKKANMLDGRNVFIYPQGIYINANFDKCQLNKWCITYWKDNFITCNYYSNGKLDRIQYSYSYQQNVLVESIYEKGKVISVEASSGNFFDIVKNKEVKQLCSKTINRCFDINNVKGLDICVGLRWYGEQNDGHYEGFGIIMGDGQLYSGYFQNKCLEGVAIMLFPNGTLYHGEVHQGICCGVGRFQNATEVHYKNYNQNISQSQFQQMLTKYANNGQIWFNQNINKVKHIYQHYKKMFMNAKAIQYEESLSEQPSQKSHFQNQSQNQLQYIHYQQTPTISDRNSNEFSFQEKQLSTKHKQKRTKQPPPMTPTMKQHKFIDSNSLEPFFVRIKKPIKNNQVSISSISSNKQSQEEIVEEITDKDYVHYQRALPQPQGFFPKEKKTRDRKPIFRKEQSNATFGKIHLLKYPSQKDSEMEERMIQKLK